jgi:ADP-heptose:LPS heptosyltransferase
VENDFQVPNENIQEARNLLLKLGVSPEDKHVTLQPFTSSSVKNWPLPKYLALARHLRESGFKVLFGGGPSDRASLVDVVQNEFPVSAGTSLLTSAALANLSRLVVGGDTGLLQIAIAMQKPVLMLVNSPNTMTVPYGHPERALAPEPGRSIDSISVEAAVEKCRSLLFGNSTQPDKLNLQ